MKMTLLFRWFALPALFALAAVTPARAGNWPQWRGPNFNGSSDETNLPSEWSKESALWSATLPGPAAATPVIWGDLVFAPTPDPKTMTLHALCLDRKTGKVLWDQPVGEGRISHDERSNFASPSPVADAERVYFFFGNGALVAFDHAGKQLWSRDIQKEYGEFAFNWTFSASPTLYGGKLYLQVLQRNVPVQGHGRTDGPIDSYLLALDPATGKTLWRQVRPTDAVMESHEAYSTPIPFDYQGRKTILLLGANYVTAHDPETGKEVWRSPSLNPRRTSNWRQVSSPVPGNGIVLACQPQPGSFVNALKPAGEGDLPDSAIIWKSDQQHREISSDVPTPLFYDGDFFILSDGRKSLTRVEPATGNVKWTLSLPGNLKYEASPTGADGKIYLMNFGADVVIVDAAKGEVLRKIPMGDGSDDQTRSSVAISGGQFFIRTNQKLYCLGKK
jgi:outer membrane protein assembly factor BamB